MLGRVVAGTIASVALLCASISWAGWVYLHTVGDPHRTEEIATAVLDDSDARHEIAGVLADQIVERTGLPFNTTPTVATAVDSALGDERISANLIDAFGSAHARALGVDDTRPTTIDTAALIDAVRDHLAVAAPTVAASLDALIANVDVPQLTLPDLHTDAAGRFRSIADKTTTSLGILAVTLLGLAFVIGDRRRVVRRFGTWAVFSGIGWLAGPYLVAAIAKQFASDLDHTIDAVRRACQGPVIIGSIVLVGAGVAALVAWLLPIWPAAVVNGDPYVPVRAGAARPPSRPRRAVAGVDPTPASVATTSVASVATAGATSTRGPVDTFSWSGQQPPNAPQWANQQAIQQSFHGTASVAPDPWAATMPTVQPQVSRPAPSSDDADPWSMYFDPNQR